MAGLADLFAPEDYDPKAPPLPNRAVPVRPFGELKPLDADYYRNMPVMDKVSNIGRTLGQAAGFSPTQSHRMGEDTRNLIGFVPGAGDAVGAVEAKESLLKGDIGKGLLQSGLTAIGVVPGVGDVVAKAGREGLETLADTMAAAVKAAPDVAAAAKPGIRAYHGSNAPITKLSHSMALDTHGRQNALGWGRGKFYFSRDEPVARSYSIMRGADKPIVNAADLAVHNPIHSDDYEKLYKEVSGGRGLYEPYSYEYTDMDRDMYIERLDEMVRAKGHDGIVDDVGQVAIFDPDQAQFLANTMAAAVKPGIKAYHGSPHSFDRFDMSKIGTGEGAQAYGHGLYFAENEGVAKSYRDTLSNRDPSGYATAHLNAQNLVTKLNGDADYAAEVLRDQINAVGPDDANFQRLQDTLKFVEDGGYARPLPEAGSMYEVNIDADPEQFLDWDKPLTEQPHVRQSLGLPELRSDMTNEEYNAALDTLGLRPPSHVNDLSRMTGDDYVSALPKQHGGLAPEERLKQAGIPGIKYLDAGSRGAAEGSRNYVVFDDKLISIVKKYGIPAALGAGLITEEMARQMQDQGIGGT